MWRRIRIFWKFVLHTVNKGGPDRLKQWEWVYFLHLLKCIVIVTSQRIKQLTMMACFLTQHWVKTGQMGRQQWVENNTAFVLVYRTGCLKNNQIKKSTVHLCKSIFYYQIWKCCSGVGRTSVNSSPTTVPLFWKTRLLLYIQSVCSGNKPHPLFSHLKCGTIHFTQTFF